MTRENKCDRIRVCLARTKKSFTAREIAVMTGMDDEPQNVYRKLRYMADRGEVVWASDSAGKTVFSKKKLVH